MGSVDDIIKRGSLTFADEYERACEWMSLNIITAKSKNIGDNRWKGVRKN